MRISWGCQFRCCCPNNIFRPYRVNFIVVNLYFIKICYFYHKWHIQRWSFTARGTLKVLSEYCFMRATVYASSTLSCYFVFKFFCHAQRAQWHIIFCIRISNVSAEPLWSHIQWLNWFVSFNTDSQKMNSEVLSENRKFSNVSTQNLPTRPRFCV